VVLHGAAWPRLGFRAAVLLAGISTPAAAQGTAADQRLLESIALYTGVAGRIDDAEARRLLEAVAADRTDVLAIMWIARVHSTGRMTFAPDPGKARQIASGVIDQVRYLAASGDVEAAFLMGTAYDESLGVEQDYPEAMRWYRRAAHRGHVLAAHNVGNMFRDGRGVDIDHATAAMWWLRAARAGDVIPALRLGEAYEAGRGIPQSLETARAWYEKAAAAGNSTAAEALERLGR
jgi:TPR repeat protein